MYCSCHSTVIKYTSSYLEFADGGPSFVGVEVSPIVPRVADTCGLNIVLDSTTSSAVLYLSTSSDIGGRRREGTPKGNGEKGLQLES